MPASKYTQEQRDQALELYEAEGPSAVTARFGIPKQTVQHWAKAAGIRTVRTAKTNAASEAKQADDKAVRAMLASDALSVAQLAAAIVKERLQTSPDEIPAKDLATLFGIFTDKHIAVAKMDQDRDTTATDSVVDQLLEGFRKQAGR